MAPHSSTLAWKIPWMEEPGRLQSMGSLRAGHDWVTSLLLFTLVHWRRKWQPTPVFLPGESQGRGSLVGCHLWGHTESDTTEVTDLTSTMKTEKNRRKVCYWLCGQSHLPTWIVHLATIMWENIHVWFSLISYIWGPLCWSSLLWPH